jgi:transposase
VFCCAFFCRKKGLDAKDIHKEMFTVYGWKCLSRKVVHNWVKKFSEGRSKVADDARPGRPVEIPIEATAAGGRVDSS